MSALQMSALEGALQTWFATGSGLAGDHVVWAAQNAPPPAGTYISIRVTAIRVVGLTDVVDVSDNPTPSAGAEILQKVHGQRLCTLTAQCFADPPIGVGGAMSILHDVLTASSLPSVSGALSDGGVGLSSFGDVRAIGGDVNYTVFESRAIVEIKFYAAAELVEAGTYIEFVQATSQIPTPPETFQIGV